MVTTSPLSDKGLNGELKMRANPKSANEATHNQWGLTSHSSIAYLSHKMH